jgi:peptide chain release factor 1
MSLREKLTSVLGRYTELEHILMDPKAPSLPNFSDLSKEYHQLEEVSKSIQHLEALEKELADLETLKTIEDDITMREMAQEETIQVKKAIEDQELMIRTLLLPKDQDDNRDAILEIRAGTGGEEAALFAGDLMRMYCRYAESKGWKVEYLHCSPSDHGGIREASLSISGKDVFSRLKFEAGVHRVQRVPETEASGRIHTSAATVAVLPEAEEIDIHIEEKDLRIDVFRSSGPGGQSVNTTDSAVRVTHIPTGIVVQQQDEKSQHKNKAKALKILRARLYDQKKEEAAQARASSRHEQVGRGDRSERIRTYNFPQSRLTDHRIKLTLYKLSQIMEGGIGLDEVIDALITEHRAQQLMNQEI